MGEDGENSGEFSMAVVDVQSAALSQAANALLETSMQGLRESVAAAVELHFNADSISARVRESNLHWLKQAQNSKKLHTKRETFYEEKIKTVETRSNRRIKGAEQQTQFLKGRLEFVTKERDTRGEELDDVKNRLVETKEVLENTSRDKEVLKGELEALKTLLEKEREAHKAEIGQLQRSLSFEQVRSKLLDQSLKAKEALDQEKDDQASVVTRLEGELKEAQEASRAHDNTFTNDSKMIYTAATLVAGATEDPAGNQLDEGEKLLCSVQNGFADRRSKRSRNRANKKRKRKEEEERLEMDTGHNSSRLLADLEEESAGEDPAVTV